MTGWNRLIVSLRSRARDDEGMTLVEVLAAMFILSVAVIAIASVASASLTTVRIARDRDLATAAASAAIESIRAVPFGNVAHDSADGTLSAADPHLTDTDADGVPEFDHDGPGGDPPEELDIHADGEVNPYLCTSDVPCWGVEFEGDVTLRTFVTVYDEGGEEARRVTAVVTWTDRNAAQREVRESTVVARARRGLPVPNFDIDGEQNLMVEQVEAPGVTEICFVHTFRNLGARDSYDVGAGSGSSFASNTGDPDADPPLSALRVTSTTSGDWLVEPWLGTGATAAEDGAERDAVAMRDSDGDHRLETAQVIENDAEEPLQVCFTPPAGLDESSDGVTGNGIYADETIMLDFRSTFDETVVRTVTYRLVVGRYDITLFLDDTDPSSTHDRPAADTKYFFKTTAPAYGGQVRDYDRNLDPNDHPGIFLQERQLTDTNSNPADDGDGGFAGFWDWQFASRTVLSDARSAPVLTFGSGHDDSLRSGNTSGRPAQTLKYRIRLIRLNTVDASRTTVLADTIITDIHDPVTNPGFRTLTQALSLGGDVVFEANEYLRLELTCEDDGTANCHVMYDHTSHQSRLTVSSP